MKTNFTRTFSFLLSGLFVFFFSTNVSAQTVDVTAPASIAGSYNTTAALFGAYVNGESGTFVLIDDGDDMGGMTSTSDGCEAAVNAAELAGNIAMIDRGACGFVQKTQNAEAAGAIAVIVCNNSNDPDATLFMGGSDCDLTIPATMVLSYNDCLTIKAELANGVTGNIHMVGQPAAGESFDDPLPLPGAGTYTTTMMTGFFSALNLGEGLLGTADWATFGDSIPAQVYSVTAPSTGVMNVNSCLNGVDTRVAVLQGCRGGLSLIGVNDDACELEPDGAPYASELDVVVFEGEEYLIQWDRRWLGGDAPFDFDVSFGDLPMINTTFTVDMSQETVSAQGVSMAFATPGGLPAAVAMTDTLGDGTWSTTLSLTTLDTIQYRFVNGDGMDLLTYEMVPAECAVPTSLGVDARQYIAEGLEDESLPAVCFASCEACPVIGCNEPLIDDNLDSYTLGAINAQGAHWNTWDFNPGGGADGLVSDEQALSGSNSILIEEGQAPDVLLLLGDQTSGKWMLKWDMYIVPDKTGYYNIQEDEQNPGTQWNLDVFFNNGGGAPGAGVVDQTGTTFSYPEGAWFPVVHFIDLDNDLLRLTINGAVVEESYAYPFNLGSIDFFSIDADNRYYIDNVLYKQMAADSEPLACEEGTQICDNFEAYSLLTDPAEQSPYFAPWSAGGNAGEISADISFTDCQSLKIDGTPGDVDNLLLLGDKTSGQYILSWKQYVGAGLGAYHNIQKIQDSPGGEYGNQIFFNNDGTGDAQIGGAVLTFTYTQDEWIDINYFIDIDQDNVVLTIEGTVIYTAPLSNTNAAAGGTNQLGAINLFPIDDTNIFYVDELSFRALPECPMNAIICDYIEGYQNGTSIIGASPWWTGWSGNDPGTAEDAFVTTDQSSSSSQSVNIGNNGTTDILLLLGDQDAGNYQLNWHMYVPAGATAYFNLQGDPTPGADYVFEALLNWDATTPGEGDAEGTAFTYPEDAWFDVQLDMDADNDLLNLWVDGTPVLEGFAFTSMVSSIDFWSNGDNNNFYIDNVIFVELPPVINQVNATFTVDMSQETLAGDALINGEMTGGMDMAMTDNGDGTWSITLPVAVNSSFAYRFKTDAATSETVPAECANADGDRTFGTADVDITLDPVCYESCTADCIVAVQDPELANAISMYPNPASGQTNLVYDFETATDLSVRLTNNLGQVVFNRNLRAALAGNVTIDLSHLATGMYFLQVTDGTAQYTEKLVVE